MVLDYVWAFVIGGAICVIGQLLIDFTKLTPARILVSFVTAGVILTALGLYGPLVDFAGAGATVPLTGFGYLMAEGTREARAAAWAAGRFLRRCGGQCSRYCGSGVLRLYCRAAVKILG